MALSQPGIFNALDYGLKAVGTAGASPGGNQTALQAAITACQSAGGGTVLIPAQDLDGNTVYQIVGPIRPYRAMPQELRRDVESAVRREQRALRRSRESISMDR